MTVDYNNGQIHGWNGGECPVHPKTLVECWTQEGGKEGENAEYLVWDHRGRSSDIIAFRVTKVYREPKTVWLNEYDEYRIGVHLSPDDARTHAGSNAIRIAVKYQEVLED